MRYAYPLTVEEEPGGYSLYFDGLAGATWAETPEQAVTIAKDLLVSALEMLIEDGVQPPAPRSRPDGS